MTQVKTKKLSWHVLISNPYFRMGYKDRKFKSPFNPNYDKWTTNHQWYYERGRQAAAVSNTKASALEKHVKERTTAHLIYDWSEAGVLAVLI